jgi:hypothetical protein
MSVIVSVDVTLETTAEAWTWDRGFDLGGLGVKVVDRPFDVLVPPLLVRWNRTFDIRGKGSWVWDRTFDLGTGGQTWSWKRTFDIRDATDGQPIAVRVWYG